MSSLADDDQETALMPLQRRFAEGDPASPISRGRLWPKGAASKSLHNGPLLDYKVK